MDIASHWLHFPEKLAQLSLNKPIIDFQGSQCVVRNFLLSYLDVELIFLDKDCNIAWQIIIPFLSSNQSVCIPCEGSDLIKRVNVSMYIFVAEKYEHRNTSRVWRIQTVMAACEFKKKSMASCGDYESPLGLSCTPTHEPGSHCMNLSLLQFHASNLSVLNWLPEDDQVQPTMIDVGPR